MKKNNKKRNRNHEPTRILATGLNWSGSGAVVDFLNEYDGVTQVPGAYTHKDLGGFSGSGEFSEFQVLGLVGDQLKPENDFYDSSILLKRYIERRHNINLLFRIGRHIYKGIIFQIPSMISQYRVLTKLNECYKRLADDFIKNQDRKVRLHRAKSWISEVVKIVENKSSNYILFDQPLNIAHHIDYWPFVFDPFKLIIIYRDPRDIFVEQMNVGYWAGVMKGHLSYVYGRKLDSAIKVFIDMNITMMNGVDEALSKLNPDEVLLMSFEEFVQNYEDSKAKIEAFLGLKDEDHVRKRKFFNPDKSIKNIGLYKNMKFKIPESLNEEFDKLMQWYQKKRES